LARGEKKRGGKRGIGPAGKRWPAAEVRNKKEEKKRKKEKKKNSFWCK
jgi:hypothetical protein